MKNLKDWKEYSESISGWELVGKHMGPGYPEQELQIPLSKVSTEVIAASNGEIYTWDDYRDLWNEYLKLGGKKNISEFTKGNLDEIIDFLSDRPQ